VELVPQSTQLTRIVVSVRDCVERPTSPATDPLVLKALPGASAADALPAPLACYLRRVASLPEVTGVGIDVVADSPSFAEEQAPRLQVPAQLVLSSEISASAPMPVHWHLPCVFEVASHKYRASHRAVGNMLCAEASRAMVRRSFSARETLAA
jgi:hypothetical protein